MQWIGKCVAKFEECGYVTKEQSPWLCYALERRISTLFVAIPFVIIGALVSPFETAISFLGSFCFLRDSANGFHAHTVWGCFAVSIIFEFLFLCVFLQLLSLSVAIIALILAVISILGLAPYNDPNIHLSAEEIIACKKSTRIRLAVLLLLIASMFITGNTKIAEGITLGVLMSAFSLIIANLNIKTGGYKNEQTKRKKNQENS